MNTEINKKKGRFMTRKYKEIYDNKFLELIPEKIQGGLWKSWTF